MDRTRPDLPADVPPNLRIGVALGGGSARGYAHIGALASLERHGLAPDVIAGTSFGAVVGALYASGRSPDELSADASRLRRRDVLPHIADFGLHRAALFGGLRLQNYFERLVEGRSFEDLERDLVVVTTDVDSGERVLLRTGPLAPALRASASMPGIFAPVELDGRRLIDGGIGSPIPLDTLDGLDVDLAVGIGAGMEPGSSSTLRSIRRFLRSPLGRGVHRSFARCDRDDALAQLQRALAYTADGWLCDAPGPERLQVHTKPPIHWLNFHRADEAIAAGAEALERFVPQIRAALGPLRAA
jgi:NTE family protein